ncbi:MAG TPA: protein translocase subunit SecF [Actinomycetota bacterium]|nr:protein translocase subunit SecF [Actinomycetota bacterium]
MNVRRALDTFRGYRHPEFRIVQRRRRWAIVSGVVIAISLLGLFWRGLNYSIDFTGGTLIEYAIGNDASVEEIRDLLESEPYARESAEVQFAGTDRVSIRTTPLTDLSAEQRTQLFDALADQARISADDISAQVVGPTWGEQISRQALIGLLIVLAAITLYITLRFEWKMALGAMVAMLHDVIVTAGVYALTGREVSPATVIAILTILGFSLYDTVVIYDKVKENVESTAALGKDTYEGVANTSMNQVLMRSVNTSLVVVLPIVSLLLFGGDTLKDFAFAMLIGVMTGAYSSIFVATPILVVLKEREPRYQQLRARIEGRPSVRRLRAVPATSEAREEEPEVAKVAAAASSASTTRRPGTGPSRPRPKSKRRPPAKRRRR